jgi:hypothetical protein
MNEPIDILELNPSKRNFNLWDVSCTFDQIPPALFSNK